MLKIYVISFILFIALDMLWLGIIARNLYREYLGFLLGDHVNVIAGVVFYLIFISGLVFFVINPAVEKNSSFYSLLAGAFFGLVTYSTYELTNLAVVKKWPIEIVVIDIIWGVVLASTVSFLTYLISIKLTG